VGASVSLTSHFERATFAGFDLPTGEPHEVAHRCVVDAIPRLEELPRPDWTDVTAPMLRTAHFQALARYEPSTDLDELMKR
jgi:hypothetical protein